MSSLWDNRAIRPLHRQRALSIVISLHHKWGAGGARLLLAFAHDGATVCSGQIWSSSSNRSNEEVCVRDSIIINAAVLVGVVGGLELVGLVAWTVLGA